MNVRLQFVIEHFPRSHVQVFHIKLNSAQSVNLNKGVHEINFISTGSMIFYNIHGNLFSF